MKVRGKAGCLVADPGALDANPRRYAGMQRKADCPDGTPMAERYEPCEQVCRTSVSLEKACQAGDIDLVNECRAASFEAAAKAMTTAAKSAKGDK